MQSTTTERFDALARLVKEVKPSVGDRTVVPEDSVIDDLGFDSLDMLQLARKIHRQMGLNLDLDTWNKEADKHRRTLASILDSMSEVHAD